MTIDYGYMCVGFPHRAGAVCVASLAGMRHSEGEGFGVQGQLCRGGGFVDSWIQPSYETPDPGPPVRLTYTTITVFIETGGEKTRSIAAVTRPLRSSPLTHGTIFAISPSCDGASGIPVLFIPHNNRIDLSFFVLFIVFTSNHRNHKTRSIEPIENPVSTFQTISHFQFLLAEK